MNSIREIAEFKNPETQQFFTQVVASSNRLVYAKWRKGKLVKAVYEAVY